MENSADIAQIVGQAAKNKPLAQRALYNMFHREMLGLCIRLTGSNHLAEDILQEGFVKAFTKIKSLHHNGKFHGWLKRIMVHECMNYQRKAMKFEELDNYTIADESDEDDNWYKLISFEEINKEIDLLPNGCRQIFTLHLIENYKHKEIANMLGISVSTAKSQYQYALKLLRDKLKERLL